MPLDQPITITQAANAIGYWLEAWAEPKGGKVKVMMNMAHLWEEIYEVNDAPRILICYNGEVSRGGFPHANVLHRVDRQWIVVVMRGHGFKNLAAEAQGSIEAFYDSVEAVRDRLRVMGSITEEFPIDYKSTKPLPNAGRVGPSGNVFLDAYAIEFSTANDIPRVLTAS